MGPVIQATRVFLTFGSSDNMGNTMQISDEIRLEAPRRKVYAALNDPEILKRAIPGCEEIERVSETEMRATVTLKIGPIKARFKGKVMLSDLKPPESYTITGEGTGGVAGFAKGSAKVSLDEDGAATILRYRVEADVGGKLAQLGGRLIEAAARKLAGDFFARFKEAIAEEAPVPEAKAEAAAGLSPVVLLIGGAVVIVVLYFVFAAP